MSKDGSERRTYRKSPGRQYGYEYDPLHGGSGQGGQTKSGREGREGREGERSTRNGEEKSGIQHTQRPNLRRTRQLLRQNILASKGRIAVEDSEFVDTEEPEQQAQYQPYVQHEQRTPSYDEEEATPPRNMTRNRPSPRPNLPATRELEPEIDEEWDEFQDVDPDIGYEDPLDNRLPERGAMAPRSAALQPSRNIQPRTPTRSPGRSVRPPESEEYYEDDYYEDDEEFEDPQRPRRAKKRVSRRGLLLGLGAVAVGGAGVAAYELVPKIPGAINSASANIEHQLQDAFNKGVSQGADAVRKEFITTLENIEGVSLDTAINAAALTRVAYDTFVSPIINFSANIAGDFLSTMLRAFRSARGFLQAAGQDNTTLASIQKVLESWVAQVTNMPKQLDAITDADLDGAQSYLHKLKNTLEVEKAKLNQSQSTTPTAKPTGTPAKH